MKPKKIFALLFLITFLLTGCQSKSNNQTNNNQPPTGQESNNDQALTPEEVLAQLNEAEGVGLEQGPINVEIISPEEESWIPSQARLYEAKITGLVKGSSCYCDWKFYLNEYDEEILFEQMDDRQCTGSTLEEGPTCGFTSTFIDSRGDLRVVLDVEVKRNYQDEVVQTATAERKYRVE